MHNLICPELFGDCLDELRAILEEEARYECHIFDNNGEELI